MMRVTKVPADSLGGAWRLVALEEPGADGVMHRVADATGSLIYTPDGRMSVQVMFASTPAAAGRLIIRSTRADEHWSVTWERP